MDGKDGDGFYFENFSLYLSKFSSPPSRQNQNVPWTALLTKLIDLVVLKIRAMFLPQVKLGKEHLSKNCSYSRDASLRAVPNEILERYKQHLQLNSESCSLISFQSRTEFLREEWTN